MAQIFIRRNNSTVLSHWVFKFAPGDTFGIVLEGYKRTGEVVAYAEIWGSFPIVRRINATTLASRASQYQLEGPIFEKLASEQGLPHSLISLFRNGFPENWDSILQAYWTKLKETNVQNAANWFDRTALFYGMNTQLNHEMSRITLNRPSNSFDGIISAGEANGRPVPIVHKQKHLPTTNALE